MGNLNSARRKLNAKSVHFAQQVEKKKLDLAKEFVKERVQKDAEFARDVLKAVGDLLPEDIKTLAKATVQKDDEEKVTDHGYILDKSQPLPEGAKPFIADGGCSMVDVPKEELLKALEVASERQTERLKKAGLLPEKECCGHDCGCHARPSDEEMMRPMGDPQRDADIAEIADVPLGDGFVATQSDGGGQVIVHETEITGYQKDGLSSEEDPTVTENDLENALKKHISNSGI